jgi:dTDP-4-dehydrorhamnose reductase
MIVLITGSNGLLGQKIVKQLLNSRIPFIASSQGENRNPDCPEEVYRKMDISSQIEISAVFQEIKPTHVIHTAAITNVDYCELNPELCYAINVDATLIVIKEASKINAHFQLLSSDFIFDGENGPYTETDTPNPLSHYATSKWQAEQLLHLGSYKNWSIVRTIIVYGQGHQLSRSNLILWAKESLLAQKEISVIDDQFRAPTWADDLAWACIQICQLGKLGVYNACGPETLSIYDIVLRIATFYNCDKNLIKKINSKDLNQAAIRPPKTGLVLTKSFNEFGYSPKLLEETLKLLD